VDIGTSRHSPNICVEVNEEKRRTVYLVKLGFEAGPSEKLHQTH